VIAARRARLKMDSERGFLGDECLVALAIAIIEARFGFSDQRAEFDARPDARKLADGFHSSVRGFDLPFGRRAIAAGSTHLTSIPRSLSVRSRTIRDGQKGSQTVPGFTLLGRFAPCGTCSSAPNICSSLPERGRPQAISGTISRPHVPRSSASRTSEGRMVTLRSDGKRESAPSWPAQALAAAQAFDQLHALPASQALAIG
jgi:hypothetical protein